MITKDELMFFFKAIDQSIDNETLEAFASLLIVQTEHHPLPSLRLLENSSEARGLFSQMLGEYQEKQTTRKSELTALKQELINMQSILEQMKDGISEDRTVLKSLKEKLGRESAFSEIRGTKRDLAKADTEEKLIAHIDICIAKCDSLCSTQELVSNFYVNQWQKKDDLVQESLRLHSKQYEYESTQTEGPVHFIHFHERTRKPRVSEYLQTYDSSDSEDESVSFDKTNHGIGTGVYGMGALSDELIQEQIKLGSCFKVVTLEDPLRLSDAVDKDGVSEAQKLTELSKYLQRICDEVKRNQRETRNSANGTLTRVKALENFLQKHENSLKEHAEKLSTFVALTGHDEHEIYEIIKKSLGEFLEDSRKSKGKDMVVMPINYVVTKLGFGGVIGKENDRFPRGLIAFSPTHESAQWDKLTAAERMKKKHGFDPDPLIQPMPSKIPKLAHTGARKCIDACNDSKQQLQLIKDKDNVTEETHQPDVDGINPA